MNILKLLASNQVESPPLTYINTFGNPADSSTYTYSSVSFGSEDATREIFVIVYWASSGAQALISATIGGISATITNPGGRTRGVTCFFATVPTGASGNIVITFGGVVLRSAISVYRVVNRTNIGTNFTDEYNSFTGSFDNTFNISGLNINTNGFALGGFMATTNILPVTSSDLTVDDNDNFLDGGGGVCANPISRSRFGESSEATSYNINFNGTKIQIYCGVWAFD